MLFAQLPIFVSFNYGADTTPIGRELDLAIDSHSNYDERSGKLTASPWEGLYLEPEGTVAR